MSYHEVTVDDVLEYVTDWETAARNTAKKFNDEGKSDLSLLSSFRADTFADVRRYIEQNRGQS